MNETIYNMACGDGLEVRKTYPDRYCDLIVCSPPYEAARTYGIGFKLKGEEWVKWAVEHYLEDRRICKGVVAWVIEGQTRQYRWSATPALFMAELHRRGVHLRKPPIFKRIGIPGSGGPDWLRNDYEFIVCSGPGGKLPWSDNTAMGHTPKWGPGGEMSNRLTAGTRRNQWGGGAKSSGAERLAEGGRGTAGRPSHRFSTTREWTKSHTKTMPNGDMARQTYHVPVKANPGNVIRCLVGGGVMGSRLAHENEAPYPEKLAEFFIRSFCPPDGIVGDFFSGSGTTAAVAIQNGRRFVGCDVRQSMVDLTLRRIAEVQIVGAA